MSDVALRFLLANLAAAIAILLVIALRKPARAAFGARLAYGLWLLVPLAAFGSLLPPRVVETARPAPVTTASYPPPSFAPDFFPAPPAVTAMDAVDTSAPAPTRDTQALDSSTPASRGAVPWSIDPWTLGILVWLTGALAMAIWQLRGQLRFLADARAGFAGPAVAGVFNPRIITPADFEDRFEQNEREVILAHEKIHLANNDARINALVALLRCLCWFNPFVHVAAHLMRIDQELACDATVVERHPRAKAVYASALLKAQLASRPLPLGCYWPAGTEHPLTERVEMLRQAKPGRMRRLAGAACLAILAAGASVGAWAAIPPEKRIATTDPSAAPVIASPAQAMPEQIAEASPAFPRSGPQPESDRVEEPAAPSASPSGPEPETPQQTRDEPQGMIPAPELKGLPWILQDRADPDAPLDLRGVVTSVQWVNPATRVHVREDGTGKDWVIETSTPNSLLRLGTNRATLQEGARITARGFAPFDKTCAAACLIYAHPAWMTLADKPMSPPPTQQAPQPIRYEPQQAPATPQGQRPAPPTPPRTFAFSDTPPETAGGQLSPARLNAGVRIYLRGKIERLEFGDRTYVAFVRATSLSNYENGRGQNRLPEAGATVWALSPTNYFDNRETIEADLVDKEIEAEGLNINEGCKPDCRMKATVLRFARTSEVPAPLPGDSLISQFAVWYDTGSPNIVAGTIERLAFHDNDRTFDVYIRSDAANGVQSRLFQVRTEYRHVRADIERALAPGKRVSVSGWRAREWAGAFCAPVCGMLGNSFTTGAAPGPFERVTPDGPALTTLLPARPVVTPQPTSASAGFRLVALKRERLVVSSRDVQGFVDRDFEPGEEYRPFFGNDWMVSTPNGAAFEWRFNNASLGPLADAGPVKSQRVDDAPPSKELVEALARREELMTRYSEKHPEVREADTLIRELLQRRKAQLAQ